MRITAASQSSRPIQAMGIYRGPPTRQHASGAPGRSHQLHSTKPVGPGELICDDSRYTAAESGTEVRAIYIVREFGTVTRPALVTPSVRLRGPASTCWRLRLQVRGHATEFNKLARIQVVEACINAELQIAEDLKNTGKGQPLRHLRRAAQSRFRTRRRVPVNSVVFSSTAAPGRCAAAAPTTSPSGT
jgi:hypothetical protein